MQSDQFRLVYDAIGSASDHGADGKDSHTVIKERLTFDRNSSPARFNQADLEVDVGQSVGGHGRGVVC